MAAEANTYLLVYRLGGEAILKYVNEWIVSITDITPICKKIHSLISENIEEAIQYLPEERIFTSS